MISETTIALLDRLVECFEALRPLLRELTPQKSYMRAFLNPPAGLDPYARMVVCQWTK